MLGSRRSSSNIKGVMGRQPAFPSGDFVEPLNEELRTTTIGAEMQDIRTFCSFLFELSMAASSASHTRSCRETDRLQRLARPDRRVVCMIVPDGVRWINESCVVTAVTLSEFGALSVLARNGSLAICFKRPFRSSVSSPTMETGTGFSRPKHQFRSILRSWCSC